jgi:hypothetical protein
MRHLDSRWNILGWVVVGFLVSWVAGATLYLNGWDRGEPPMVLMALSLILQISISVYGTRDFYGMALMLVVSALLGAVVGFALAPEVASRPPRIRGLFDAMHFGRATWVLGGAAIAMGMFGFFRGRIHSCFRTSMTSP